MKTDWAKVLTTLLDALSLTFEITKDNPLVIVYMYHMPSLMKMHTQLLCSQWQSMTHTHTDVRKEPQQCYSIPSAKRCVGIIITLIYLPKCLCKLLIQHIRNLDLTFILSLVQNSSIYWHFIVSLCAMSKFNTATGARPCHFDFCARLTWNASVFQVLNLHSLYGWLVVLRIYFALAIFQPYRDLEAGDNQSLKS